MRSSVTKMITLALATFFCSTALFAQQKNVLITDAKTKLPVSGALASGNNNSFTSFSDDEGKLNLTKLPSSVKTILITSVGYETKLLSIDSLATVISLQPVVSSLKEVQVTAPGNRIFKTISDLDIHLRPIVNSQEVLRMVPGLFIGQHAGGGKAEQIFLRGFDIDHGTDIAIAVDGIPVNMVSHAHGQGYADLHFVIPELIDKVSFDKGPYFAAKGNFNTAGFVDFKTKDYLDRNFVKVEGGQYTTGRIVTGLSLLHPSTNKGKSLIFGGEASYSDGYFEHKQNFNRFNALLRYTTPTGKNSSLSLSATAFNSKWYASGQIPDRAVESGEIGWFGAIDPKEGGKTSRYNVNAIHTAYLNNGASLTNQLFYSHYRFDLFSNFTFFLEDPVNGDEIEQKEARHIIGYNSAYKTRSYWGNVPVQTEFGINARQDFVNDLSLSHTVKRQLLAPIMFGDVSETNVAIYGEQQYQFNNKLKITLGLRADHFINRYKDALAGTNEKSNSSTISPKINLTYNATKNLMLYLYNGRGFHSNDTRVAVPQNGRRVLPPAYGNDLGAIWKPAANLMLQAAAWHLWLSQEFVYVGDAGVVEPGGKTRRMGVDLSARYEPVRYWYADLSLNYAHARSIEDPRGENYIPLAPSFTSVGGITYRRERGFNGSLRYRYMADRPANEDNSTVAKGYFVTDLALNYTNPKWETGIAVQNILNTKWKETQFDTESRLFNEPAPVSEIHFTPGTPFFLRASLTLFF